MQPSESTSRVLLCAGGTSLSVEKGGNLTVAFQARPGVVITGGSSKLGFMDDPVSWPHWVSNERAEWRLDHLITAEHCTDSLRLHEMPTDMQVLRP